MSTFDLQREAYDAGADINAMFKTWLELSKEKNWPATEVGWSRYLQRSLDGGALPMRPQAKPKVVRMIPADFRQWWEHHPEAGSGIAVEVAFKCARYVNEWHEQRQAARRAA
jgi:hypothetical protein